MLQLNPCSRMGAPGNEMAAGLQRLRSTATAWVRATERKAKAKAAKKAATSKGGGSDEDGSDGGGSDGGAGSDGEKEPENDEPCNSKASSVDDAAAVPTKTAAARKKLSALAHASPPYWVAIKGTPLVRQGFSLRTASTGRLTSGAHAQVLETRTMLDGTLRASFALEGETQGSGWMTLIMKDGAENAIYLSPQPELIELPSQAGDTKREIVAQGESAGGAFFVF